MPTPAATERAARDSINAAIRQGTIDRHTGNEILFWELPGVHRDISRWRRVGTDPAGITADLTAATADTGKTDDPRTPKQAAAAAMRLAAWQAERPAYEEHLAANRIQIQVTVHLDKLTDATHARQAQQDDALAALGWGETGPLATEDYPGELADLRDLVARLTVAARDKDQLTGRAVSSLEHHHNRAHRLRSRTLSARRDAAGHDPDGDDCPCTVCQPTT